MTTRIRFGDDVPHWLRRLCRRWFGLLYSEEWTLSVEMCDAAELEKRHGAGTLAETTSAIAHRDIAVWFSRDFADDSQAWRTVAHELRHPFFAEFAAAIDYLWDGRRKLSKRDAHKMLADLTEKMIQLDVATYAKAMKLP